MFEAAVHDFVKQTGDDCLHPVPSLFEADLFQPLQVVVKKNRRFFWQSPKYQTQDFKLEEILIGKEELKDVPVTKDIFVKKYAKKSKLSLSGKFGAKIKLLFSVELEGSDYVHVESNFGDVEKEEVDAQKLMEVLKTKKLNLAHSMVTQTRKKPRKVLCVVAAIARTTQDCAITTDIEEKADEEIDFDKLKVAEIDEKGSVDDQKNKAFTVKAGTPLAFKVYELKVKGDGSIEVMFDPDTPGGFVSGKDTTDGDIFAAGEAPYTQDGRINLSLYRTFAPIIDLKPEEREKFTKTVLHICETPVVAHNFVTLLKQAYRSIKREERKYSDIASIQTTLGSKDTTWTGLLEFAGFSIKPDNSVVFPTEMKDGLTALRSMFEAIQELEDDAIIAVSQCTKNLAKPLFNLCRNGLDGKEIKMKDSEISVLYADSNAGQDLAHEVGFTIKSYDTVCPPDHKQQLKGAYRVVYALWGTKEESD